jgi:hypothetical protein
MQQKAWLKHRGYLHLTNPIKDSKVILAKVQNPKFVAKHAFFPLLHKIMIDRRYKKTSVDELGNVIRKNNAETRKERPLHYADHIDSHIYAYYAHLIQEKYKNYLDSIPELSACITAYRKLPTDDGLKNKNTIHFAKDVFDYIRAKGKCVAMAFDIEKFFPSLNHLYLKKQWAKLLGRTSLPDDHYNVFWSVTRYAYIFLDDLRVRGKKFDEKKIAILKQKGIHAYFESPQELREAIQSKKIKVYKNFQKGIPQGLPMSANLANIYMLAFDEWVLENIVKPFQAFYRRYSDDIVLICDEENYLQVQKLLNEAIAQVHLTISEPKTEVHFFDFITTEKGEVLQVSKLDKITYERKPNIPLTYLGFSFYGHKTLIKSAGLAKYYRRMKQAIKLRVKRTLQKQAIELCDELPIFKRKLYKHYTHLGKKSYNYETYVTRYKLDRYENRYKPYRKKIKRKSHGNFISYAYRAYGIMQEPAILRQIRNHWKIFHQTLTLEKVKQEKTF